MLATQSLKFPGYPYASALPFCTDQRGRVVVLISHLAEHTQNADRGPAGGFPGCRLRGPTCRNRRASTHDRRHCRRSRIPAVARATCVTFPEAEQYLQIGGFRFFRIEPLSLRYIAGFGSIHTIPGESYLAPALAIAEAEGDILAHMNAGTRPQPARLLPPRSWQGASRTREMIGIDCDGFDVRADGEVLRFDFEREVKDAGAGARRTGEARARQAAHDTPRCSLSPARASSR